MFEKNAGDIFILCIFYDQTDLFKRNGITGLFLYKKRVSVSVKR